MSTVNNRIKLQSLSEVMNKDDDWSGMDSAARRKRQNRLNQRAYRRRKAQQEQAVQSNITWGWEYRPFPSSHSPICQASDASLVLANPRSPRSPTRSPLIPYLTAASPIPIPGPITFPLTPDHLITLFQYNVLRATLTNMSILSLLSTLPLECGNALAIPVLPAPTTIPSSLEPTPLQRSTKHDLWIDTVPLGQMRDNLILMKGSYDHDDLCSDMVGGLFEGFNECENRGILVWSEPWCAEGWEVTEGFARKWGRLLRGCGELIESTNRWRGLRGEEPLVVEV